MTQRYRLTLEYDGSPYSGWQRQDDRPSVQGAVERALTALGQEDPVVQGAGRTDAGVHAIAQVAHTDLDRDWQPFKLMGALNANLREESISILAVERTGDDFHARFSASARHYLYRIISRRGPLTFEKGRAWNVKVPLDAPAMNEAAKRLLGTHDFTTFRSTECQAKSPVKSLDRLDVTAVDWHGVEVVEIAVSARSFLHNQVRSLAGSLKLVGDGKWSADDLAGALEAADRTACGPVAPAHGLYLVRVDY